MDAKRGFVPEDVKNFSPQALEKMRTASRHVCYLINEGYDLKQSTTFVGNHYLLSERQRLAIMRSVATNAQIENRRKKQESAVKILRPGIEVMYEGRKATVVDPLIPSLNFSGAIRPVERRKIVIL